MNDPIAYFEEGQWWVKELDNMVENGTPDQKRSVAVVHHLLRSVRSTIGIVYTPNVKLRGAQMNDKKEGVISQAPLNAEVCRTDLGEKLLALRRRAIANGMKLLTVDEINDLIDEERRGEAQLETD